MRSVLIWMALVNVALAAMAGFFVAEAPSVFGTGGIERGEGPFVPFALVAAFPMFCLFAAVLPLLLHGRGATRSALGLSLLPACIAVVVYAGLVI